MKYGFLVLDEWTVGYITPDDEAPYFASPGNARRRATLVASRALAPGIPSAKSGHLEVGAVHEVGRRRSRLR